MKQLRDLVVLANEVLQSNPKLARFLLMIVMILCVTALAKTAELKTEDFVSVFLQMLELGLSQ
jgi:hypothetical protein